MGDALGVLIRARLDAIESFRDGACRGDPDAIHDMRVATRRLQAVVRICKDCFRAKRVKKIRSVLRDLIVALGEVREYDVLADRIKSTASPESAHAEIALGLMLGRIASLRNKAHRNLVALLHDDGHAKTLDAFRRDPGLVRDSSEKTPSRFGDFLRDTIPGLFNDFLAATTAVAGHPRRTDALHTLRIEGKPLRYVMEFGEPCFGARFSACYKAVKAVIALLGEIHDDDVALAELKSWLREVRDFNRAEKSTGRNIAVPTVFLLSAIRKIGKQREERFARLCGVFFTWHETNFSARLAAAVSRVPKPRKHS